jgi:hypothetical protein
LLQDQLNFSLIAVSSSADFSVSNASINSLLSLMQSAVSFPIFWYRLSLGGGYHSSVFLFLVFNEFRNQLRIPAGDNCRV